MVPAAEAAVGKNWLPTLVLGLASFLLCTWMSIQEEPEWKWLNTAKAIVLILLVSWALDQTYTCWPGEKAEWAVPAGLILLAVYAVWKKSAIQAASVLRYGVYVVLGAMAILGVPQLKIENLRPLPELPDMMLATVLLLPLLGRKSGTWMYNPVGIIALISSVVAGSSISLYQYSRGITIRGVAEHMESLAACAITVGYFALLCYLLDGFDRSAGGNHVWLAGLTAFGIYGAGIRLRPEVYVLALLLLWVIFPLLWSMKQKMKKYEKSA